MRRKSRKASRNLWTGGIAVFTFQPFSCRKSDEFTGEWSRWREICVSPPLSRMKIYFTPAVATANVAAQSGRDVTQAVPELTKSDLITGITLSP